MDVTEYYFARAEGIEARVVASMHQAEQQPAARSPWPWRGERDLSSVGGAPGPGRPTRPARPGPAEAVGRPEDVGMA